MSSQKEMSMVSLEEKVNSNPDSLAFSRLADLYRKSGNVQEAIAMCAKGLQKHPEYITGRIILGRCYLEQENFEKAIKEFSKVCQLDRRNQIAMKMLADIFSKQGMEDKAGDLYTLLKKIDPDNPSLEHLANVFRGKNRTNLFDILGIEIQKETTGPTRQTDNTNQPPRQDQHDITTEIVPEMKEPYETTVYGDTIITEAPPISITDSENQLHDSLFSDQRRTEFSSTGSDLDSQSVIDTINSDDTTSIRVDSLFGTEPQTALLDSITETPFQEPFTEAETKIHEAGQKELDTISPDGSDISSRIDSLFSGPEKDAATIPIQREAKAILPDTMEMQPSLETAEYTDESYSEQTPSAGQAPALSQESSGLDDSQTLESSMDTEDLSQSNSAESESSKQELSSAHCSNESVFETPVSQTVQDAVSPEQTEVYSPQPDLSIHPQEKPEGLSMNKRNSFFETIPDRPLRSKNIDVDKTQEFNVSDISLLTNSEENDSVIRGISSTADTTLLSSTAVLDRDAIDKIISFDNENKLEEIPKSSLSGEEVMSRLDEMFPERSTNTPSLRKPSDESRREPIIRRDDSYVESLGTLEADTISQGMAGFEDAITDGHDIIIKSDFASSDIPDHTHSEFPDTANLDFNIRQEQEITSDMNTQSSDQDTRDAAVVPGIQEEPFLSSSAVDDHDEIILEGELESNFRDIFADRIPYNEALKSDTSFDVPEEASKESEPVGEFYTEWGEAAKATASGGEPDAAAQPQDKEYVDNTRASETIDIPAQSGDEDTSTFEFEAEYPAQTGQAADGSAMALDKTSASAGGSYSEKNKEQSFSLLDSNSPDLYELELIQSDNSEETSQVDDFYTETGKSSAFSKTFQHEKTSGFIDTGNDILSDDISPAAEISLRTTDLSRVSPDDAEDDTPVSDFYTEKGENLLEQSPSRTDMIDFNAAEESFSIEDREKSDTVYSDTLAEPRDILTEQSGMVDTEQEAVCLSEEASNQLDPIPQSSMKKTSRDQSAVDKKMESTAKADAIPDHVLTPTLADIYFQQDQPYLAEQIYKRLFQQDPSNEKLHQRIRKIEEYIREKELSLLHDEKSFTKNKLHGRRKGISGEPVAGKKAPLKGIKIKKKIKARIKKAKKKLEE